MGALAPPLDNSYWVIEHRLLAGEFPGGRDESDSRERLRRLCEAGVSHFVDLTHDYERPPYARWLAPAVRYSSFPIADTEIPERIEQMRDIQQSIRESLAARRGVYVHCRAGVGRTGLVIGCYLVEQGLNGPAALKALNKLWKRCARSRQVSRVPQTPQQAAYISRWAALRVTADTDS